jgi:signal transduction histidine kinase
MARIEPGLLPLFRLLNIIIWVVLTLAMCGFVGATEAERDYFAAILWVQSSFLFAYLHWQWLQRRLDRVYLPLALLVATLCPIFGLAGATLISLDVGLRGAQITVEHGAFYFWLMLPLLLVSTQYGMKTMLAFTVGTSLLPWLLALPLEAAGAAPAEAAAGHSVIRLFLFGVVGFVIVRLTSAQRRQRDELAQKNAQLSHYAGTLEQLAITRERNRMARELHDTLAHTLSAVNMQLKALEVTLEGDPTAARQRLHQIQDLTRTGLNEARRSLHALRASPLEDLGLVLALERQAQQTAERAGLQLRLDLPPQLNGLRPEVEQTLYRIAEEAMNNVARHALATHLIVALRPEGTRLRLVIMDNGIGFDSASAPPDGHFGLTGMGERAMLIDGDLRIDSQPGRGTRIELSVER